MNIEDLLKETLAELLKFFSESDAQIDVTTDQNTYKINVSGLKNAAMLIGYHGENLHALQHIFKTIAHKKSDQHELSIILDIDNYKKEHENNIISLAERKVEILRKTKKIQILPPMPAYLRRIIHIHFVQDKFNDVQTESVGEFDHRQITLKLKK